MDKNNAFTVAEPVANCVQSTKHTIEQLYKANESRISQKPLLCGHVKNGVTTVQHATAPRTHHHYVAFPLNPVEIQSIPRSEPRRRNPHPCDYASTAIVHRITCVSTIASCRRLGKDRKKFRQQTNKHPPHAATGSGLEYNRQPSTHIPTEDGHQNWKQERP